MIITGRTINQLPTLSSITSGATLILQTGNTTFKANLSEFAKSPVFGSMYQDLIPVSSNTFSIGTTGSTIKTLYVTSGSVIVGQSGIIGIDSSGNTYSTSGISTPSLFIGNVTTEGIKSTGITINIVSGDTVIVNQSGQSINLFKQIVPTGGSISQVLSKSSGNDYDFEWLNLQGLYITGATSNGGGLNIYQSATTNTLSFKTVTSVTPTHISIADSNGLLSISGTGILSISNNGAGAFVAQSGTSSTVALRSLSSQTPSNLSINASGDLIIFSGKTFYDSASNSGGGQQVLATNTIPNMTFRTLSSSTPNNLNITTNDNLIIFSATNTSSSGITGATNSNNGGIGIFKSADTQTLTFRTLSSTSESLLVVANGDGLITFTPRQKYHGEFSSLLTQSATSANTMYVMSAETTDISQGITVVNGSRFTVISAGTYNIQFSAQLERVGNGSSTVDIWFRKNGNNIARSNSQITLTKNSNDKLVASWNLLDTLTAGQYFEIAWSSVDTGNVLRAQDTQTNPTRPEIPSVIVTVFEV